MIGSEARNVLTSYWNAPPGRALHAMVAGRAVGVIPTTARGCRASPWQPADGAAAVVLLAIEGQPATAAGLTPAYLAMRNKVGGSFHDALTAILDTYAESVAWVRICKTWPAATVVYDDGSTVVYGGRAAADAAGITTSSVYSETVLPGSVLASLAMELRPVPGGWAS